MPTATTTGPVRLRYATAFTVHGETTCHHRGHGFQRGDKVTETRLHTDTQHWPEDIIDRHNDHLDDED